MTRPLFKVSLWITLILLLIPSGIILYLNISLGKDALSSEIKMQTGIKVSYTSVLPRRLDVVRIRGLKVNPAGPVVVPELDINVNLKESLKARRPVLEAITVLDPIVSLEAESILSHLKSIRKKQPISPRETPPLPTTPAPQSDSNTAPTQKPTDQPKPAPPKPPPPRPTPSAPVNLQHLPKITVVNGTFSLTSRRLKRELISLKGLSFKTDPHNLNRSGIAELKTGFLLGKRIPLNLKQPILLTNKTLQFPETKHHIGALTVTLTGNALASPFLPFHGQLIGEIQDQVVLSHPEVKGSSVSLGPSKIALQASGALSAPLSTRAILQSSSHSVLLSFPGKKKHHFTSQRTDLSLQRGQLSLPQFHFKSDDLSLMGNGIISSSGKGNAVFRLVGSPLWKTRYTRLTQGLLLNSPSVQMEELDTPDRFMKDLHIKLSPETGVKYRFNEMEDGTSLDLLLNQLQLFLKQELNVK